MKKSKLVRRPLEFIQKGDDRICVCDTCRAPLRLDEVVDGSCRACWNERWNAYVVLGVVVLAGFAGFVGGIIVGLVMGGLW